jgi:ribosomal protein S18 acetylase RimI-like enzyme
LADASSLAALSAEVWLGTYLKQGISAHFAEYVLAEMTADRFRSKLGEPGTATLVAEAADGLTGYIRIAKDRPVPDAGMPASEISTFYVRPGLQGQGIGSALLDAALLLVSDRAVWLTTNAENANAIGFYLSKGFRQTGETLFRIGEEAYPNVILVRDGQA